MFARDQGCLLRTENPSLQRDIFKLIDPFNHMAQMIFLMLKIQKNANKNI